MITVTAWFRVTTHSDINKVKYVDFSLINYNRTNNFNHGCICIILGAYSIMMFENPWIKGSMRTPSLTCCIVVPAIKPCQHNHQKPCGGNAITQFRNENVVV
jgi:hypothetical protein